MKRKTLVVLTLLTAGIGGAIAWQAMKPKPPTKVVTAKVEKQVTVTLEGADRELLGQTAAAERDVPAVGREREGDRAPDARARTRDDGDLRHALLPDPRRAGVRAMVAPRVRCDVPLSGTDRTWMQVRAVSARS